MEERLNEMIRLKKAQNNVITLRTEVPQLYAKYLVKECKLEVSKLLSCEVELPIKTVEIPPIEDIPIDQIEVTERIDLSPLKKRADNIEKCLQFVKND